MPLHRFTKQFSRSLNLPRLSFGAHDGLHGEDAVSAAEPGEAWLGAEMELHTIAVPEAACRVSKWLPFVANGLRSFCSGRDFRSASRTS